MKLSSEEIVAILRREYDAAESYRDSELADDQAAAIDYYEGRPLGNEVDARSQIILNVVAEAVDYMVISVLRTFISGDRIVEFEAKDMDGEEAAEEATESIHYIFMREQDGYKILHDFLHSGLLERYGAVKTACVEEEKVSREVFVVDGDTLTLLESGEHPAMGEGYELEDTTENDDGTFNATIKMQSKVKRFVDIPLPSSEYRFSNRARHEDDCDYNAHICRKTRSELVEMGFDKDQVYDLKQYEGEIIDEREYARDRNDYWRDEESSPALEEVLYCEEYARLDVDGDGIAERVKVCRVNDEILINAETGKESIETIDEQPIVVFTPFPRAHRMVGNSLADKVMDIHSIKSVTARQLMDSMYMMNNPRPVVDMTQTTDNTIEDLLNPVIGSPVRVKGPTAITPLQTGFDVSKSLAVLEFWTGEQESVTGITRLNQGLDADTLNKTATGTALMQAQGQQYEEFIARNFAEALSRLFAKKLRLMRREGEKFKVKIKGEYREVDPATWPEDMNLNIRVGLGTGRKDERVQNLMTLAQVFADAAQNPSTASLVTAKGAYKIIDGLIKNMGLGQTDDYVPNPDEQEPQEPQPDPALIEAQAKQQEMQAKLQLEGEKMQGQLQLTRMQAEANIEMQREKNAMDMDAARERNALDAQLARDKAMQEADLAERKFQQETILAARQMEINADMQKQKQDADIKMKKNRPGGDLDK